MKSEQGFTLIELLTICAIIGLLSALGLTTFQMYRGSAAYGVAETTLRNARNAVEASINKTDATLVAVPLTAQSTQGQITDPSAAQFLPGMMVPRQVKFQVSYDPACTTGACTSEFLQVNHCMGNEFVRWIRFGDGIDVTLEHLAGTGCP